MDVCGRVDARGQVTMSMTSCDDGDDDAVCDDYGGVLVMMLMMRVMMMLENDAVQGGRVWVCFRSRLRP